MKKVIELNPENAEALNYVAYNNITEDPINLLEAESLAQRALKIMPDSYQILDTMGWVLYKKGETDKAKKLLETALELSIKEKSFEMEIFEHLFVIYSSAKDDKSCDSLKNMLLEMLNSDDYNDNKAEIRVTLERLNDSATKRKN